MGGKIAQPGASGTWESHAPQSRRSVEIVSLGGSPYGRGLVAARRLIGA